MFLHDIDNSEKQVTLVYMALFDCASPTTAAVLFFLDTQTVWASPSTAACFVYACPAAKRAHRL